MKYTKDHEWLRVEDDLVVVGITEHAATALGDVVFVELPEPETMVAEGDAICVIESGESTPARILRSVVLPAPLSPRMTTLLPRSMARSWSSTKSWSTARRW